MKKIFYFLVLILLQVSGSVFAATPRVNVDGVWYNDGQTAFIDCSKTFVYVFVDAYPDQDSSGTVTLAQLRTRTSSNFTTNYTQSSVEQKLNLDPNRQDGFLKASLSDFNNGNYTLIYITQKPPVPSLGAIPTLCSNGNTGSLTAQISYPLQSSQPANLVWQTNGGITINGNSSYTLSNATSGSAPLQFNSSGTVTVYATIPGCNNLQGPAVSPVYFGPPQFTNFTVDNSSNSGPHSVAAGSTHYFTNSAAFGYVPAYSISASTNYGNIVLNLTGVSGGSGQIYVSGSTGNASLHIYASNTCGSASRDETFYIPYSYQTSPNPARSNMAVTFNGTEDRQALPDQIELVSEKDQRVVRSVNIADVYEKRAFKNGNEIMFDVKDLPRGTYYLRVINLKQVKDRQVEMTRLIFE